MSLSLEDIVSKIASQGNSPDISFLKDNPEAQTLLLSAILSHINPNAEDKRKYDDMNDSSSETTKKAGRKPLTDEEEDLDNPKLKRKAQNRAAQRAFRERKENKVRELEDKVKELEESLQSNEIVTENEKLKEMIKQLQQENTTLMTSSFDLPLSVTNDQRPQKIMKSQVLGDSPVTFDSSDYSVSSKSRSNTPESMPLTVDDILLKNSSLLPSNNLIDEFLNVQSFDPNFNFFYPLDTSTIQPSITNTTIIQPSITNTTATTATIDLTNDVSLNSPPTKVLDESDLTRVWDRISEHPRFDEVDIDDLCDKMKKKATCNDFDHDKELEKIINEQYPI